MYSETDRGLNKHWRVQVLFMASFTELWNYQMKNREECLSIFSLIIVLEVDGV